MGIGVRGYRFAALLARATPFRSGDALAGIAAASARGARRGAARAGRRAAARFLNEELLIPYERTKSRA
jgi:ethanolamine ammonia-lyase large subunit